jgi:hypothetical protein
MQKDRTTGAISHMEPGEIALYELYQVEGLPRGDLPYTPAFERIVAGYNGRMNTNTTHHDVWRMLENVLKQGEEKIATFLGQ